MPFSTQAKNKKETQLRKEKYYDDDGIKMPEIFSQFSLTSYLSIIFLLFLLGRSFSLLCILKIEIHTTFLSIHSQNEYTDWERPPRNQLGSRDAALELLSDGHTVAPLVRLGYLHSLRGGKSYFMHLNHRTSERDFPQVGPQLI